jgi:hypothetical protein
MDEEIIPPPEQLMALVAELRREAAALQHLADEMEATIVLEQEDYVVSENDS